MIAPEERAKALEAVRLELAARKAREEAYAAKRVAVESFLSTLAPLVAGRARKSLERSMRWTGGVIAERFLMIERLIADGARLDGAKLKRADGSFYDAEALTSYGLAYAAHLSI